jgi:hypothetical protein
MMQNRPLEGEIELLIECGKYADVHCHETDFHTGILCIFTGIADGPFRKVNPENLKSLRSQIDRVETLTASYVNGPAWFYPPGLDQGRELLRRRVLCPDRTGGLIYLFKYPLVFADSRTSLLV